MCFSGIDSYTSHSSIFCKIFAGVQYFFHNFSAPNVAVYCLAVNIQNSCCDVYLSVSVCDAAVFIFTDLLDTADLI